MKEQSPRKKLSEMHNAEGCVETLNETLQTLLNVLTYSNLLGSLSLEIVPPGCGWGPGTAILSIPHAPGIADGEPGGHNLARDWATVTGGGATAGGAPKVFGALVPGVGRMQ